MKLGPYAAPLPLSQATFAVLDVETTGLSPTAGDRVCEVACLRVTERGDRELGRFASLVDPRRGLSEGASRVNGITPAMLAGAPGFAAVVEPLFSLLAGAVLVAHNAPFDLGFLAAELGLAGYDLPRVPVVDTLALARNLYHLRRYNLPALAEALGIETRGSHRAMGDVQTTAQVLRCLLEDVERGWNVVTLGELVTLTGNKVA